MIEVDENLRPRMLALLAAQPARFPLDRAQLGQDLPAHLRTCPLDDLAVAALDAALRLLTPHEGGLLWEQLEQRIATTPGAWAWAGQATARAAAAEAPRAAQAGPTVLAAIHATQAAALLRRPGGPGREALWREVARQCSRHPDPAVAARLEFRAICALAGAGDTGTLGHLARRWQARPTLVDDSLVAVLDKLAAAGAVPPELVPALDELCQSTDPQIAVTALLARASRRYVAAEMDEAVEDVDTVLRLAARAGATAVPRVHWVPVLRPQDRARLARLVLAVARSEPPTRFAFAEWRTEALDHVDGIDSERLVAATVLVEHCWRPVALSDAQRIGAADVYRPDRQPTYLWHHAVPSLCEMAATACATAGDVDRAAELLRDRREAAVASGLDPVTIDACDRGLVALSRAGRTTALTSSVHRAAHVAAGTARFDAWATLALVSGESPGSPDEAGAWSTWFRTQIVRAGRPFEPAWPPPSGVADVDLLELTRLTGRDNSGGNLVAATRSAIGRGLVLRQGACAELGTALRAEALSRWPEGHSQILDQLPPRMVADTALAEAELLALRLPGLAIDLLWYAVGRARAAGDPVLAGRAAVLLVLSASRAGIDVRQASAECHAAVHALPFEGMGSSGWPRRHGLAVDLLENPSRRWLHAPGDSPELDPTPVGDEPTGAGPTELPEPVRPDGEPAAQHGRPPSAPASSHWLRTLVAATIAGLLVSWFLYNNTLGRTGAAGPTPATDTVTTSASPTTKATPTPSPASGPPTSIDESSAGGESTVNSKPRTPATPTPATPPPATPEPTSSMPISNSAAGTSEAVLFVGFIILIGLALGLRAVLHRGRFHPLRPRLAEYSEAYPSAAHTAEPLPCLLSATSFEIVVTIARSPRFRRRSRWSHPVVPLLGQRHGNVGHIGEQELAQRITGREGVEPLVVRFRQARLPVTWRLWETQPMRGTPIVTDYRGPPSLAPVDRAAAATEAPRAAGSLRSVLHLVGTSVSTAAGWRLRIAAAVSSSAGIIQLSRSVHGGETLVGPDDLAVDSTALVVLQAEPVDGPPQPLGEQYEGMCALAADIRDAGAGAVLVVPPLPDAIAHEMVRRIRTAMTAKGHRTHPVHVLDLAQAVKDGVASVEPDRDMPPASRDVLLFA